MRGCNLTTTSPLPHANDCPNEVRPLPHTDIFLVYFLFSSHGHTAQRISWSLKRFFRLTLLRAPGKTHRGGKWIVHCASIRTGALRQKTFPTPSKDRQSYNAPLVLRLLAHWRICAKCNTSKWSSCHSSIYVWYVIGEYISVDWPHFVGPRLLVAPVGVLGATTRDVYLPKLDKSLSGMSWKHWFIYFYDLMTVIWCSAV